GPEEFGVTVNGITYQFLPSAFDRVVVNMLGGNDGVVGWGYSALAITKPITINLGDGNDYVELNPVFSPPVTVFGGAGDDTVSSENYYEFVPQLKMFDGGSGVDFVDISHFAVLTIVDMSQTMPNVENAKIRDG